MKKFKLFLSSVTLFFTGFVVGFAEENGPLLSVILKSYEALTADVSKFATAIGEDASIVEMQLEGMLSSQVLELIDKSEPWHVAVWLDSSEQPPVVAIVLPVNDFEAFKVAAQSSMIGMLGAQLLDAGDRVILLGSSPGMPVAEGWTEKIQLYAENLELEPTETVQLRLTLNDSIRQEIVAAVAPSKDEMMSVLDDPDFQASGVPPETMKEIMEIYFSIFEGLLGDLEDLHYGVSVSDTNLRFSLMLTPLADSKSAKFLASQNIDISDLATSALWDSDMTLLMGLAAFPDDWQEKMEQLMEGLMPLYGLSTDAAAEWTNAMNKTLPYRGVYHVVLDEGIKFSGFYDILGAPAKEVYNEWLEICKSATGQENSIESYYSAVNIEKDHRSQSGHSVDLLELTINPEHPTMQLPEQKAVMEQLLEDGKIKYEMSLVDDRIYIATEGELGEAMAGTNNSPPLEITPDTRFAGSMNFISFAKMGTEISEIEADIDFSKLDPSSTQFLFKADVNETLSFEGIVPLKLIEQLSEL